MAEISIYEHKSKNDEQCGHQGIYEVINEIPSMYEHVHFLNTRYKKNNNDERNERYFPKNFVRINRYIA